MTQDFNPYNPYGYEPEIPGWVKMTAEEREQAAHTHLLCGCVVTPLAVVIALLLCWLFSGCTTTERVVTVERHTTDTLRITQYQRDSIYLSDSIYISDFVRDDTVIKTVERWHTQYRDRWHTDTVYQSRTDSVPYPVEVIREVERKPSKTERGLMIAGLLSLLAVIVFAASRLKRFLP